jgi:hypothetical protein
LADSERASKRGWLMEMLIFLFLLMGLIILVVSVMGLLVF